MRDSFQNMDNTLREVAQQWEEPFASGPAPCCCCCLRHRPSPYKSARRRLGLKKQRRHPLGPWRVTFTQNFCSNGPRRLAFTPPSLAERVELSATEHRARLGHGEVRGRGGGGGGVGGSGCGGDGSGDQSHSRVGSVRLCRSHPPLTN